MGKQGQKPEEKGNIDTKGINVSREEDLSSWYTEVLTKAQLISYYDVQDDCYILEPPIMFAWEQVRNFFDAKIRTIGVRNCYYPLFISKANLEREQEHIEGFSAEVAWVTHGGHNKLETPMAVRPTSETGIYRDYSDKIKSHRDLPFRRNQWANVVRWEFSQCLPLLRSREFLWQEGHTVHLTQESADEEVLQILDWYAQVYEELLAVPVVKGRKTENEKFAGALYTTTIESLITGNGRAIQAATSHALGQHFSKMFDITVEDPNPKADGGPSQKLHVSQNSWGLSTRSLGAMIMIHGDNKGVIFPPRVAEYQVALIPVGLSARTSPEDRDKLLHQIENISKELGSVGVRVECDTRSNYTAAWKMSEYELRGVPLRLEYGPKDAAKGVVTTVRRDTGEKGTIAVDDVKEKVASLLEQIQEDMFQKAKKSYHEHIKYNSDWSKTVSLLNEKNVLRMPHCGDGDCAEAVKKETAKLSKVEVVDERAPSMGAKALCVPFDQAELPQGTLCIRPECGKPAINWTQFGRSY
ncbi:prolyl-tRNA synthetase-like protein [Xylogone sp. PMI_703]|nr:prolyl-tRNA synthetase-like protein [Xylogone sp. PMI_703]